MKKMLILISMFLGLLLFAGCFTIQYVENPYTSDKTTVGITRDLDALNVGQAEAKDITDYIVKALEKEQAFNFIDKRSLRNKMMEEIYKEIQNSGDPGKTDEIKRKVINLKYMLVGNISKTAGKTTAEYYDGAEKIL